MLEMKFTRGFVKAMEQAQEWAISLGSDVIETDHVLLAVLNFSGGRSTAILEGVGIDRRALQAKIVGAREPKRGPQRNSPLPTVGDVKTLVHVAIKEARQLKVSVVGVEFLLMGFLANTKIEATAMLLNAGLSYQYVRDSLEAAE